MARLPLTGGAYQSRTLIAAAQACINLYPERTPPTTGEPEPVVHLLTPGLIRHVDAVESPWRGMHLAKTGSLYGVAGRHLYAIGADWTLTRLAELAPGIGPVSMADNSVEMLIVDGTASGWWLNLITGGVVPVQDDAFYGADRVRCVDQFFVLNRPGTNQFYMSDAISRRFNPLYTAAKAGLDRLVSLDVVRREVWLFGQQLTEIYGITGAADFPVGIVSGGIEHGCAAPHSVARTDGAVFWLSRDRDGQAVVLRGAAYQAQRVSNHGLEAILQGYAQVDDAVGHTRQHEGHTFYVLSFPAADATWAYDLATEQWHELRSGPHRHRIGCHAFAYGKHVAGDCGTGALYEVTAAALDDDGTRIRRVRAFPHVVQDSRRVTYQSLTLDMQTGTAKPGDPEPMVSVRWSDDRGAAFGAPVLTGLGLAGDALTMPKMCNLGHARDRVFEVSWDAPVATALAGAWIETAVNRT